MSQVMLIAADKPLPLCDFQEERTKIVTIPNFVSIPHLRGKEIPVSHTCGFMVSEHAYYRHAVDELGYPIKPYQYELALEQHQDDLEHLRQYLSQHFSPGEEVELWNIWVGVDSPGCPPHFRGRLADFDMDTLAQFDAPVQNRLPGQCWLTITV